jgi:nucleoid DNA-binding protein
MANPNYDNVILGSGIAGLTVFHYLAESTRTRNLVITNNIASQTNTKFPLGPRFLHQNKDTEALLRRLGFPTKTREVFIGYKINDDVRNFATDDFKNKYAFKAHGTNGTESSHLTGGGKSSFTAFEVSQVALGKSLLKRCLDLAGKSDSNHIIIANIKNISHRKVTTDKDVFYGDNIISTIPLPALTGMLSNTSVTVKISTTPDLMNFFLVDEKGRGQFDYIYSVTDPWHRKTYVPELDKWVYETKTPEAFLAIYGEWVLDSIKTATQISRSLKLRELGSIKLVGRYAQMNHSIKTEDVIHWAHNYTRKFNGKKNEKSV